MTFIGQSPRLKRVRNLASTALTIQTDDSSNIVIAPNKVTQITVNPAANILLGDFTDNTKQIAFSISGSTTGKVLTLASIQSTSQTLTYPNIAGADTVATLSTAQTFNSVKTFSSNPVITAITSGSYTMTLPTADGASGTFLQTNGSGTWSFQPVSIIGNVAANDSAVVFTSSNNRIQICTPTAARTYTLPTTGIVAGDVWTFFNTASTGANVITVQSSGSNTIDFVLPGGKLVLISLVSTPTTAANWQVLDAHASPNSYTPTFTGLGTVSAAACKYSREGSYLSFQGSVTAGTVTGSLFSITLPISLALATPSAATANNVPSPVIGYFASAIGMGGLLASTSSSTTLIYCGSNSGGASGITPQNGNGPFGNSNAISFFGRVPISGWGG